MSKKKRTILNSIANILLGVSKGDISQEKNVLLAVDEKNKR